MKCNRIWPSLVGQCFLILAKNCAFQIIYVCMHINLVLPHECMWRIKGQWMCNMVDAVTDRLSPCFFRSYRPHNIELNRFPRDCPWHPVLSAVVIMFVDCMVWTKRCWVERFNCWAVVRPASECMQRSLLASYAACSLSEAPDLAYNSLVHSLDFHPRAQMWSSLNWTPMCL